MKVFFAVAFLLVSAAPVVSSAADHAKLPKEFWVEIKPGKAHEECVDLKKDAEITYRFKASQPVPFNIHFHTGKGKEAKVEYGVKLDAIDAKEDVFRPSIDEHYCWMWTNKTTQSVTLSGEITTK